MTEAGRLGAFITKVKKGSLADVVGHLRAGANPNECWVTIWVWGFGQDKPVWSKI